jgi:hypothetical protein
MPTSVGTLERCDMLETATRIAAWRSRDGRVLRKPALSGYPFILIVSLRQSRQGNTPDYCYRDSGRLPCPDIACSPCSPLSVPERSGHADRSIRSIPRVCWRRHVIGYGAGIRMQLTSRGMRISQWKCVCLNFLAGGCTRPALAVLARSSGCVVTAQDTVSSHTHAIHHMSSSVCCYSWLRPLAFKPAGAWCCRGQHSRAANINDGFRKPSNLVTGQSPCGYPAPRQKASRCICSAALVPRFGGISVRCPTGRGGSQPPNRGGYGFGGWGDGGAFGGTRVLCALASAPQSTSTEDVILLDVSGTNSTVYVE